MSFSEACHQFNIALALLEDEIADEKSSSIEKLQVLQEMRAKQFILDHLLVLQGEIVQMIERGQTGQLLDTKIEEFEQLTGKL